MGFLRDWIVKGEMKRAAELEKYGHLSQACEALRSMIDVCDDRNLPEVLRGFARLSLRVGRLAEAREAFENLTKIAPGDAEAWFHLANVCVELRDTYKADECYHEAIKRAPDRVDILHAQAELYALKMPKAGLEAGKRAVRTMLAQMKAGTFALAFPRELPLVFLRNLSVEQRLTEDALEFFKELVQASHEDPTKWVRASALLHAGLIFANTGKYDEAIARYREALREDARATEAHFNLAMVHHRRLEHSDARKEMTLFSKDHPKSPVTTYGMALLAEAKGDLAEAERLYRFFQERCAKEPPPVEFLARLDLGRGWRNRAQTVLDAAEQHRREGHEGHIREVTDEPMGPPPGG